MNKFTYVFVLSLCFIAFSCSDDMQSDTMTETLSKQLKNDKVDVCHKGEIISVSINAVQSHLDHGDKAGSCDIDYTFVPDDNFEAALFRMGHDDIEGDNLVPTANISGLTILRLWDRRESFNIADLTGIQDFKALVSLIVIDNQLTELDVSGNTELRFLNAYDNQLTELDVSGNTLLFSLQVHYNQLTELDVSGNTALSQLRVDYNQLTELDVSGNTALSQLYVGYNQLADLKANNGSQIYRLDAPGNADLTCIEVFNGTPPTFSDMNASIFSEDCTP